ncbi:MAG: hypothetical protein PVJ28_00160 [Acidimicrobiia bacterium]|jgi:hypothetical protein
MADDEITDPAEGPNGKADDTENPYVRDGNGKFDRDPEVAARDAECARLRSRSMSYREIAAELGISTSSAYVGVRRALAALVAEPAEEVRKMELMKLDRLEQAALAVLEKDHEVTYKGVPTGVADDGPRLAAVAALQKLSESRRKLLGLDRPTEVSVGGTLEYRVVGVDPEDLT